MADLAGIPGLPGGGMGAMTGPMWMPHRPPTPGDVLGVHLQPVPLLPVLGLVLLVLYALGLRGLHRRGGSWPWGRTAAWLIGIAALELVTATGVEGYGMMMFSVHMAQHMVLAMVAPILLALGSPYTLALRSLRLDGRPRRALVALPGTAVARVLGSTAVRWVLFLGSLYGIYFTPAFGALMHTVWGHNLMLAHFLLTGCLFFGPVVGRGAGHPARRLAESFASTPLHAVFGLSIMMIGHPVVTFFDHPDPAWHVTPLDDQALAGSIAWATSETATVLVMVVLVLRILRRSRDEAAFARPRSEVAVRGLPR